MKNTYKEKHTYEPKEYIVAYIDVMGQRKSLENIDELWDKYRECSSREEKDKIKLELREKFSETYDCVTQFQVAIDDFFKTVNQNVSEKNGEVPFPNIAYSDCLAIYFPLDQEKEKNILKIIFLLIGLRLMLIDCLSFKIPVRGGIELGVCVLAKDPSRGVYGTAVSHAAELESKYADWPRIIIGKRLTKFINNLNQNDFFDILEDDVITEKNVINGVVSETEEAIKFIKLYPQLDNGNNEIAKFEQIKKFALNQIQTLPDDAKDIKRKYNILLNHIQRFDIK